LKLTLNLCSLAFYLTAYVLLPLWLNNLHRYSVRVCAFNLID
jgi:hypothetical protein